MCNRYFVMGDSHTRSLVGKDNIFPFFLGPGKEYNLSDKGIKNIVYKLVIFFKQIAPLTDNDYILLYFGEPNCRFLLESSWYPFRKDDWKSISREKKIKEVDMLISNYEKLIDYIQKRLPKKDNFFLITPTTAFFPTYNNLSIFNQKLKERFRENVIDIYNDISDIEIYNVKDYNKVVIKKDLIDNIKYDPIHLNKNILPILINKIPCYKETKESVPFKKNKKFNTYLCEV